MAGKGMKPRVGYNYGKYAQNYDAIFRPKQKARRKRLTTPRKAVSSKPMKAKNHLTLKWGTLKAWNFIGLPKAQKLLERYDKLGVSASAITQHDTPEQRKIVCKIIDLMPGKIYLAWDGKYVTKAEAKKYVLEYGND